MRVTDESRGEAQDGVAGGFPDAIELSFRGCTEGIADTVGVCRTLCEIWKPDGLPVAAGAGDAGEGQQGDTGLHAGSGRGVSD